MKIYLAGPIEGTTWRIKVEKFFKEFKNVEIFNPRRFEIKGMNHYDLINLDLQYILRSDIVLANITRLSAGTSMELVYSRQFKKETHLICKKALLSPWHLGHSDFVYSDLQKALTVLKENCK